MNDLRMCHLKSLKIEMMKMLKTNCRVLKKLWKMSKMIYYMNKKFLRMNMEMSWKMMKELMMMKTINLKILIQRKMLI
jgi:hypothetical protein